MENVRGGAAAPHGSRRLTWKMFGLLMAGAALGILGVIPYQLAMVGLDGASLPAPLPVIVVSALLNGLLLVGTMTALGLWLGPRVGLGAPLLRAWLAGEADAPARYRATLRPALLVGVGAALLILLLDQFVFMPHFAEALGAAGGAGPTPLQGLLASLYGGIVEELLLRLGIMTLLVWLASKLARVAVPGPAIMWGGIVGAALLFGLGHLPAAAMLLPLTPLWVARILLLNAIAGIGFGWLYWRYGLLTAMSAHFAGDIVLHVLAPLLS